MGHIARLCLKKRKKKRRSFQQGSSSVAVVMLCACAYLAIFPGGLTRLLQPPSFDRQTI
jgi:hypothetical protein